jgi:hypothetical protein
MFRKTPIYWGEKLYQEEQIKRIGKDYRRKKRCKCWIEKWGNRGDVSMRRKGKRNDDRIIK